MEQSIEKHILIKASPERVWRYLTEPHFMKSWMEDDGMQTEIITDWQVGHPICIKGIHHGPFENNGWVMQCEPGRILQYSHLSSVSQLPDSPENYTVMTFRLQAENGQTVLSVRLENFPTLSIYKHMNFYWTGTLVILKQQIEQANPSI